MPTTKKEFNFTIGADPEFILTMQGRKVDAKQTMELMLNGKSGFRSTNGGYTVEPFGTIGWDGASSTAEIRPRPNNNPKEVVNNMAGMFKEFAKHIKICDMSTISEFSSVGGHIHFQIPKGDVWNSEKRTQIQRRLSSFYLPVLISENKTNLNLRLKQGYGSIKDQRVEKHFDYPDGTDGYTLEFRCPSAEWLTTPKLANATLSYLGTIYHEIINHPRNFIKFNDMIYKSDKQGDALQTLAIMEYNILTDSILNKARRYIRTFEMYSTYKDEIEYIFNPKQIIKDKQKAEYNIALGWGLISPTAIPKKSEILASKKKIMDIAQKTDFDLLKRVMNIHYNDDTNVAMFAETLKDRVAAFNWKLKNNYFIFGMRKMIPEMVAKNLKETYLTGESSMKTILDRQMMDKLFNKMTQKFGNNTGAITSNTIDFTTGKLKDIRESMIMIGIPYDMRIKENINPFLSFVWALEKGEVPTTRRDNPVLIDDTQIDPTQRGEIYKILTKQMQNPPEQVVMDTGSRSLHNHAQAIDSMIQDAANGEGF